MNWDDLIIGNITASQYQEWIQPWDQILTGRSAPAFMTKFGSWFIRRPEGHVEFLDVFTGSVERIADSYESFVAEVNQLWWQETYLLSPLILRLHEENKVPSLGQCYTIPHPAFGFPNPSHGDAIELRFVTVATIRVWQAICAQAVLGRQPPTHPAAEAGGSDQPPFEPQDD